MDKNKTKRYADVQHEEIETDEEQDPEHEEGAPPAVNQ
jgi:hypothetical protein